MASAGAAETVDVRTCARALLRVYRTIGTSRTSSSRMSRAPAWPDWPGETMDRLMRLPIIAVFGDLDSMSVVK
jgi:hypothetical protein